jgi:FkbM family methyltransferase
VFRNIAALVRRHPQLKQLTRRAYPAVLWLNHWRRDVCVAVDGVKFELDLNELIDSSIYFTGGFEADATSKLRQIVREGDTVLDVGANIGFHTLLFAQLVGDTGRVVAFEPMRCAWQKLVRNIELNPGLAARIRLEKVVVSDLPRACEIVKFNTSWPLFGPRAPAVEEQVESVTLDDYVGHRGLHIDFLKVDVDGFEARVLRGAEQLLRGQRPGVMLEIGTYQHYEAPEVIRYLNACGYQELYWERGFTPVNAACIVDLLSKIKTINLFCFPSGSRRHRA